MQATPYWQQVFPPKCPASKPSTTPSTSQDQGGPAGEAGGARGRSSSRGPQERRGRSRSSTRGSQKSCRADPNDSLMDKMANFVASGWRRNLTHFIGCCWSAQIGSLEQDEWCVAITKFLAVMVKKKKWQYTGWSLGYLQLCEFLGFFFFFFFFLWVCYGVNECNWS